MQYLGATLQRDKQITADILNGNTFLQVGHRYNLTSSRVSQIFYKMVRKLWFYSRTIEGYTHLEYRSTLGVNYFRATSPQWLFY